MKLRIVTLLCSCLSMAVGAGAQGKATMPSAEQVDAVYPEVEALYIDLHRNPELSLHEQQTAARLAERMKALGYEVTTGVGGTGVVAVLRNGNGPTELLRTDMDALPIEEKTGLPYASKATSADESGKPIPVMHACGHDIHMASWFGTAKLMASNRQRWRGTLVLVGQPAEEVGKGAAAMLKDGLLTRFPKPDFALAVHDDDRIPSGQVGYHAGYFRAASVSIEITIFGRGGHGAIPQNAVDPIVIAARTVLALQTIVSRENSPFDPAVVTVGTIHGGTRSNIIPDEVRLQLTVRSFKPEVQQRLLSSIERITKAEAAAAGAPREPLVKIEPTARAEYNDPDLTNRVVTTLRKTLGQANVVEISAEMTSEDFAEYGQAGVPSLLLHVGAVEPAKFAAAQQSGAPLPSVHSPSWAPDRERTLKTAIMVETAALLALMEK